MQTWIKKKKKKLFYQLKLNNCNFKMNIKYRYRNTTDLFGNEFNVFKTVSNLVCRDRVSRTSCVFARRTSAPDDNGTHTGRVPRYLGAWGPCVRLRLSPPGPIPKCINDTRNTHICVRYGGQSIHKNGLCNYYE